MASSLGNPASGDKILKRYPRSTLQKRRHPPHTSAHKRKKLEIDPNGQDAVTDTIQVESGVNGFDTDERDAVVGNGGCDDD
ncbi:hypothetical protein ON010_g13050 [Phytophthora cinnamomi]|nr:hypothetical protein ON010_g13050 [Phytophthora cinnamomi]